MAHLITQPEPWLCWMPDTNCWNALPTSVVNGLHWSNFGLFREYVASTGMQHQEKQSQISMAMRRWLHACALNCRWPRLNHGLTLPSTNQIRYFASDILNPLILWGLKSMSRELSYLHWTHQPRVCCHCSQKPAGSTSIKVTPVLQILEFNKTHFFLYAKSLEP